VLLRPFFVSLVIACALLVPGSAGARSDNVHWIHIHLHLNAYAHWGKCTKADGSSGVDWNDYAGKCFGTTGAELGELGGVSFLNHSSKCFWEWKGNQLTVTGVDKSGNSWGLEGGKSDNFWNFAVAAKIQSTHYVSGALDAGARGEPGGPLAVHLSSHTYGNGVTVYHGYSMNLQGYLRVR
jgi:uncharacterized protein (DUF779 family)